MLLLDRRTPAPLVAKSGLSLPLVERPRSCQRKCDPFVPKTSSSNVSSMTSSLSSYPYVQSAWEDTGMM